MTDLKSASNYNSSFPHFESFSDMMCLTLDNSVNISCKIG